MTNTSYTVDTVLGDTVSWEKRADNEFIAYTIKTAGKAEENIFSKSSLSEYHPALPGIIEGLIQKNLNSHKAAIADGLFVCETLRYLATGGITLTDHEGFHVVFSEVHMLGKGLSAPRQYWLDGTKVATKSFHYEGMEIPLVIWRSRDDVTVDEEELDARYPGWKERYRIAQGLGLEAKELMQHAFSNMPEVNPVHAMPSITFD